MTAELSAIKAAGAQIIMTFDNGPVGTVIAKQWGELQIPACLFGFSVFGSLGPHWDTTGGNCNYQAVWTWAGPAHITDKTIPYFERYSKEHPRALPDGGCSLYDQVIAVAAFIDAADSFDPDAIAAQIPKITVDGVQGHIRWSGRENVAPHSFICGAETVPSVYIQWRDGKAPVIWPDGRAPNPALKMGTGWEGFRYEGTKDYEIPPWVVEYWKGRS